MKRAEWLGPGSAAGLVILLTLALPGAALGVSHGRGAAPPASFTTTASFDAATEVRFDLRLAASSCITGSKVDDHQVGLPSWTIHARPSDAQTPVLSAVTDGQGHFSFTGLTAGLWTVWEEMQPGWAPVTPDTFEVQLPPGPACVEVRFKNRQACVNDPYEPDGTAAQATLIAANGPPYTHMLEPPSDLDWSAFDAVAGSTYTISTDNLLGSTDTYLTLYAEDGGTLLAYSDDIVPAADKRSRIIWTAPGSGRYYTRVRDFYQTGERGCLGYELMLSAQYRIYLPIIIGAPPLPPPEPTPTPTVLPIPLARLR